MDRWNDLIIKAAETFRLDANLVRAVVHTESSGLPDAIRFEPRWHLFNSPQSFASHLGIPRHVEEQNQATSWGLMQVMGAVARDLGFTDRLEMLLEPNIGTFYGCKKLHKLFEHYGCEEDVVAAYNQGNNRKTPGGLYQNQRYVDKIYSYLRPLRDADFKKGELNHGI